MKFVKALVDGVRRRGVHSRALADGLRGDRAGPAPFSRCFPYLPVSASWVAKILAAGRDLFPRSIRLGEVIAVDSMLLVGLLAVVLVVGGVVVACLFAKNVEEGRGHSSH